MADTRALREALARVFGNDHRTISAFEQLFDTVEENGTTLASSAAATTALKDATVVTLSPNEELTNERILRLDPGIEAVDDGEFLTIRLKDVARTENYLVTLIAPGDAELVVPIAGVVLTKRYSGLASSPSFANDAAAAAGGVQIDELYRNGSVVQVRVT